MDMHQNCNNDCHKCDCNNWKTKKEISYKSFSEIREAIDKGSHTELHEKVIFFEPEDLYYS